MKTAHSKRAKLTLTAVGGAISAVVCTPPYALGRIGLLLPGRQQAPGDQALPGDASHREAG